jgi:hypothetical protein
MLNDLEGKFILFIVNIFPLSYSFAKLTEWPCAYIVTCFWQISYISLILNTAHTATAVMISQIISMSMQDLTVNITCKFCLFRWNTPNKLIFCHFFWTNIFCHVFLNEYILSCWSTYSFGCFFRYPDKDAQYQFFRSYLHAERPSEVCELKSN